MSRRKYSKPSRNGGRGPQTLKETRHRIPGFRSLTQRFLPSVIFALAHTSQTLPRIRAKGIGFARLATLLALIITAGPRWLRRLCHKSYSNSSSCRFFKGARGSSG